MVTRAFSNTKYYSKVYYVYGPDKYTMKEILEKYCRACYPEIEKVTETPLPLLRFIAWITRNQQLSFATKLFRYFSRVSEPGIPEEERHRLGKPGLDFETWVTKKKQEQ